MKSCFTQKGFNLVTLDVRRRGGPKVEGSEVFSAEYRVALQGALRTSRSTRTVITMLAMYRFFVPFSFFKGSSSAAAYPQVKRVPPVIRSSQKTSGKAGGLML